MDTRIPKKKNIIGLKYNKLTVAKPTNKRRNHMIVYECICECGTKRTATSDQLKNGEITRCIKCATKLKRATLRKYAKINDMHRYDVDGSNRSIISDKRHNSNNTSGYKGVTWDKSKKKWRAQIVFKNKAYYLGRYSKIEDAIEARKNAEDKYFKPYLEKNSYKEQ